MLDENATPQQRLHFALSFADHPGVTIDPEEIDKAIADGADPNGLDEDGRTPLTEAILGGEGSPTAVKRLLALGADPSKRDKNGWSPWAACVMQLDNPVVMHNMKRIHEMLVERHADRSDDIVLELGNAAREGDHTRVEELLQQGVDPNAKIISPMGFAIDNDDMAMIDLLFRYNASPDGNTDSEDQPETHLMQAAGAGKLEIVKRLVKAGADVHKTAWDDEDLTAEVYAEHGGHQEVVDFLQGLVPDEKRAERQEKIEARNPKFAELYEKQTNGINCEVNTDDVCKKLESWDSLYSIEISQVEDDGLLVKFGSLPDNLSPLADEIYEFCPDVIDQNFGCMDDMVDMMKETGQTLSPEVAQLIEGVDFEDENFGKVLLEKSLRITQSLSLWWD